MLGRRSAAARLEAAYEARVADLKEAYAEERRALNKVIDALAEQVEYLRATFGRPHIAGLPSTPGLAWQGLVEPEDDVEGHKLFLSEEEEDLLALRESGLLTKNELEASLAKLQLP